MYPHAEDKLLSVLVPCHQAQQTVQRSIESVLCQHPVEIVLAPDDASPDYACLAERYPGVVKVLTPTLRTGPGASRNRAFAASSGHYITMLDADDCFAPGAVAEALHLVQASAAQIAFFRTAYIDAERGTLLRELPAHPELRFEDFVAFHGSIHAIYDRRHWLDYQDRHSEDVLHDAQLLLAAGSCAPMTRQPYLAYMHASGLCSSTGQAEMNRVYASMRDAACQPLIRLLYQAKLDKGQSYEQALLLQPAMAFHDFVRSEE